MRIFNGDRFGVDVESGARMAVRAEGAVRGRPRPDGHAAGGHGEDAGGWGEFLDSARALRTYETQRVAVASWSRLVAQGGAAPA